MNPNQVHLALGEPNFASPRLADICRAKGAAAAWPELVAGSPDAGVGAALASTTGPFAASWTDARGRVFLAVDRFAEETLCYRSDVNGVAVDERADKLAGSHAELDPQALFDYLYFHTIPAPRTIFKGVSRLQAGHYAVVDDGVVRSQPYWRPRFSERSMSFEESRATFLPLLRQAVQRALSDASPACFLSGGTDSSTVAGVLAEVSGKRPVTYSVGFDVEGYDEMAYARIAAKRYGTDHREHYIQPADLVQLMPELARFHDQPFGNSSAAPTHFCALKARADGHTRLLAGDGGDELFGGNTRYAKQKVFDAYGAVPGVLRQALLEPMSRSRLSSSIPLLSKLASYVRQAAVPMPDRLQTYNLLDRLGRDVVLTPAFRSTVAEADAHQRQAAVWHASEGASFVNRMLAFDWQYTLADNDLVKVRTGTRLAGVDVRYPFLDAAIVDFSASLPTNFKLKGLKLRWFFKEALRGFLPDEIIIKKKHGFGLPFGAWVLKDDRLRDLARDSVRGLGTRGFVQQSFTERLVDDVLPQHTGFYGEMVWILTMLELWFRHHAPDFRLEA